MKLSEALVLRADTQRRIQRLRERLKLSAITQEGEQPPEDPQELLSELDRLLGQLQDLIARINHTNAASTLEPGVTLTNAIAGRDILRLRFSVLSDMADSASQIVDRYRPTELRKIPTIDVAALRRQLDAIAEQERELDTAIQAANWSTELEE